MLEVVSTEASYYARLGVIHEVFYQPSDGLLTRAERGAIFQNIDELLLRSGLFLDDLQGRQRNERGCLSAVSDIFLAHVRGGRPLRTMAASLVLAADATRAALAAFALTARLMLRASS